MEIFPRYIIPRSSIFLVPYSFRSRCLYFVCLPEYRSRWILLPWTGIIIISQSEMPFNRQADHRNVFYLLGTNLITWISIFDASRLLVFDGFVRMGPRRDDNRR